MKSKSLRSGQISLQLQEFLPLRNPIASSSRREELDTDSLDLWEIYIGDRELAEKLGDPLLGLLWADSKEGAEAQAREELEIPSGGSVLAVRARGSRSDK